MAKYIVKRVAMGIFSVFIVATLTFFIMNLVPGGPFVAEKSISKAAQQALAEKYGLDKPLGAQYLNYMNSLIHGDMGLSLKQRGRTVNQIIFSKLPVSARTAGLALALINQILSAAGKPVLPIESTTVEQLVTAGITTVAALINWWKNNSFTAAAVAADSYMARLKQKQ